MLAIGNNGAEPSPISPQKIKAKAIFYFRRVSSRCIGIINELSFPDLYTLVKVVSLADSSVSRICQKPMLEYNLLNILAPASDPIVFFSTGSRMYFSV